MKRTDRNLLACLLLCCASLCCATGAARAQANVAPLSGGDAFTLLPGTWDWSGRPGSCADNPQTFTVSPDRKAITLDYRKPVPSFGGVMRKSAVYKVVNAQPRILRAQVEGETRKTPSGELEVWDFVFVSNDSFCFHRTDWAKGVCTPLMVRCGGKK